MEQTNAPGVSANGIPPAPLSAAQPAQGAAQPGSAGVDGIDPTQIPAYRKLQSDRDRERAEAERQLRERDARLAALEARLGEVESSKVEALAPEEQAEYWRKQALAQQEAQRKAQEAAQLSARAAEIISTAGYDWNDPRVQTVLNRISPTSEGLATLSVEITKLVAGDLQAARQSAEIARQQAAQQAAQKTQAAQVQALEEAGVTATSTAQPVIAPRDPQSELIERFKKRKQGLVGAGIESVGWRNFIADLQKHGLGLQDLGYG